MFRRSLLFTLAFAIQTAPAAATPPDPAPRPPSTGGEPAPPSPTPPRLAFKAWGVHAVTGERLDVLHDLGQDQRGRAVPLRGPLTVEVVLLEGTPPKVVKILANAKDPKYRPRSRSFRARSLAPGVPVTWKVEVGALMSLTLSCPHRDCPEDHHFPIEVAPAR